MRPSHVLVPLDGSPLADDALNYALSVFECDITVLNVITPLDATMSESGVLSVDDRRQERGRARAEQLIERAKAQADAEQRTVDTAIMSGNPAVTILDYARSHDIDHIVIGSHSGEGGVLPGRLLGTVATTVVDEAPVTVTVVR